MDAPDDWRRQPFEGFLWRWADLERMRQTLFEGMHPVRHQQVKVEVERAAEALHHGHRARTLTS
ncbi:MAG: hypothetical protein V2J24_14995 [Pseudomonadales bacterium]|jgi:hypothetical protein|nr:hypothetical protein [Pseudomonadales bacterium]